MLSSAYFEGRGNQIGRVAGHQAKKIKLVLPCFRKSIFFLLRFLDDYEWPSSIPIDLYGPTFGGSDYQWLIMSQPKTGTHIHHDPELTDAWNALLYGHKV